MQRTTDDIFETHEPQMVPICWVPHDVILAYGQSLGYIAMTDYIDLIDDD